MAARLTSKTIEAFEVVFDPVSGISHFLSPLHMAILGALSPLPTAKKTSADILTALEADYDVDAPERLEGDVVAALDHLVTAALVEAA